MKRSKSVCLAFSCFLVLSFEVQVSHADIFDFFADVERVEDVVRKGVVKPVEKLLQNIHYKKVRLKCFILLVLHIIIECHKQCIKNM